MEFGCRIRSNESASGLTQSNRREMRDAIRREGENAFSKRAESTRRVRPPGGPISELGDAGRIFRLPGGERPLSSLCLARLSLGAPDRDRPEAEAARRG